MADPVTTLESQPQTKEVNLQVISHKDRIKSRSEKLDICAVTLIPWMEKIISKALQCDSSRGVIFHVCSIQDLLKGRVENYYVEIDGILDIIKKYYKDGFMVKQVPCSRSSKNSCCRRSECSGHVEISI
jgi:hypothetical protein